MRRGEKRRTSVLERMASTESDEAELPQRGTAEKLREAFRAVGFAT